MNSGSSFAYVLLLQSHLTCEPPGVKSSKTSFRWSSKCFPKVKSKIAPSEKPPGQEKQWFCFSKTYYSSGWRVLRGLEKWVTFRSYLDAPSSPVCRNDPKTVPNVVLLEGAFCLLRATQINNFLQTQKVWNCMFYWGQTRTCTYPLLSRTIKKTSFLGFRNITKSRKMCKKDHPKRGTGHAKRLVLDTAKHMLLLRKTMLLQFWNLKNEDWNLHKIDARTWFRVVSRFCNFL